MIPGERFGVYLHCSGRINAVQLGFAGTDLREEVRRILGGGGIKAERTSDGYLYISLTAAFDEGRPKNEAATLIAGTPIFGDCIILQKSTRDEEPNAFNQQEAHERACLMHWTFRGSQWRTERRTERNKENGKDENGNHEG